MNAPKTELVREFCFRFPNVPSKTLARTLYEKRKEHWPNLDACYQAIRTVRGNNGKEKRHLAKSPRPNQIAPFLWKFPGSSAEKWKPFILRSERILVLSDIHIPFHDPKAVQAAVSAGDKFSPDCILLNGDVCDFHSISRFDKNPTKSKLLKEISLTRQFLGWLRQKFPKARLIYKFGNHDEWFDKYLWRKAPELFELQEVRLPHLLTEKRSNEPEIGGVEFLTNQEKVQVGKLDILHGHELGKGSIAPPVNPARGFFLKTMECTLAGHLHRASQHDERSSKGKLISCWSTGCLCGLYPDYAKINKWNHSAARVDFNGREFNVTPIRILDGRVF